MVSSAFAGDLPPIVVEQGKSIVVGFDRPIEQAVAGQPVEAVQVSERHLHLIGTTLGETLLQVTIGGRERTWNLAVLEPAPMGMSRRTGPGRVVLPVGQIATLREPGATYLRVANPTVAHVVEGEAGQLFVVADQPGATDLAVGYGDTRKPTLTEVVVSSDGSPRRRITMARKDTWTIDVPEGVGVGIVVVDPRIVKVRRTSSSVELQARRKGETAVAVWPTGGPAEVMTFTID